MKSVVDSIVTFKTVTHSEYSIPRPHAVGAGGGATASVKKMDGAVVQLAGRAVRVEVKEVSTQDRQGQMRFHQQQGEEEKAAARGTSGSSSRSSNGTTIVEMKIIAGNKWECVPLGSPCCQNPHNFTYSEVPPCITSPRGFQADMFLYSATKAYVLTLPLIANGR